MAKQKTKAQLQTELRLLRAHGIGNNVTKILRDTIMWGAILGITYFTYLSIDSLSGKTTQANIDIKATGSLALNEKQKPKKAVTVTDEILTLHKTVLTLALIFGVGGIAYARKQAKLRKDVIERYHPLIQEAEKIIDNKRSTSQLTHRGDTRPEDI